MERKVNCIPCSIGILTYNSGKTLRRCLESLDGFCEIIIADGGSTDDTLLIAREYGCTVITQSNPGHPIIDFAKERNRTLDAATHGWFFYIDSDEFMSPELKEEIRRITNLSKIEYYVYLVPYYIKSHDLTKRYRQFKTYYQTRLFHKRSGARFVKKIHEKIQFNERKFAVGKIEAPWYGTLPLEMLNFSYYKERISYRLGIMAGEWQPRNAGHFFKIAVYAPFRQITAQLFKIIYLRFRYRWRDLIPLRYEFYRMYSHFVLMKKLWRRGMRLLFKRAGRF